MTADEIKQYLSELNDELKLMDIKGEISLYGGAVMCLAFKARPATKDVDAIFEPVRAVRRAAMTIADRHSLAVDWLNMAVEIFVVDHPSNVLFDLSNLRVVIPVPEYLLAMKIIALRTDTEDENDADFLIQKLGLKNPSAVMDIVADYYPNKKVNDTTILWIDNYFE
jgi:hypothetical protein